jgi:PEP-CTERM motif
MKSTKLLIVALMFVLSNTMNAANVTIGSFVTGQFTVDTDGSSYAPTQSASGLTSNLTVVAGDTWYGSFNSPIDWSSYGYTGTSGNYNNNTLGLVMSVTSQTAPLFFTVSVLDSAFNIVQAYSGNTTGLTSTPSFVALQAVAGSSALGSPADVQSIVFGWDGAGAINTTLSSIQSTIPEPSSASLLALGVAGLVALRARRKS